MPNACLTCPCCGHALDAHATHRPRARDLAYSTPAPGDYVVCAYCATACRIALDPGDVLRLVPLSTEDYDRMNAHERASLATACRIAAYLIDHPSPRSH